jgi:GPI ethanolamine phosphate transferase 3 subunit O
VLWQLRQCGKRLVFMGDDTWMALFPDVFTRRYSRGTHHERTERKGMVGWMDSGRRRRYPYPSFNVKDLHTVDDGVLEHLLPEIARDDWDVRACSSSCLVWFLRRVEVR